MSDPKGKACAVEVVELMHILDSKIIQEDLYYEPNSLIQCGWAE